MFCQKCGQQLDNIAVMCPKCGTMVNTTPYFPAVPNQPVQKKTNGCLIAVFISVAGVLGIIILCLIFRAIFAVNDTGNTTMNHDAQISTLAPHTDETTLAPGKIQHTTEAPVLTTKTEKQLYAEKMITSLIELGFTNKEAEKMNKIFNKVGIFDIENIQKGFGSGIDNLQSFICYPYGSEQNQINFTIENRILCFIEFTGIPSTKNEYYFNIFGNLKTRTVDTITSITLYEMWNDDGEYDKNLKGYQAVVDWENKTVKPYE